MNQFRSYHRFQRLRIPMLAVMAMASVISVWWFWKKTARPNILLITLDTTRADRIGCYGYATGLTPTIDSLAEEGTLFERAYTPVPLTLPAHASLLTALYPPEHGLMINGRGSLPRDLSTLTEVLRAEGFDTGAFIGSFVLHQKFGLQKGFSVYDDDMTMTPTTVDGLHRQRDGSYVVNSALKWLQRDRRAPFFCWVHLYDAHAPYLSREEEFGPRFVDQPYDAGIAYADRQIQRLVHQLQAAQCWDHTVTVIVGDHGEGLGEHAEDEHGLTVYENVMRIPWIWRGPLVGQAQRVSSTVSLVDFRPTLLELLDIRDPAGHSGRSLKSALFGEDIAPGTCYLGTDFPLLEHGWSPLRAIVADNWKYIRSPQPELYNLATDSLESQNLIAVRPDRLEQMEQQLFEIEEAFELHEGADVSLTSQERQALESLGYLSGGTVSSEERDTDKPLPDVKDMLPLNNRVNAARALLNAGDFSQAEYLLREIRQDEPDCVPARLFLADALRQQKKFDESLLMSESVFDLDPENGEAHFHVGNVFLDLGKYSDAAREFRTFLGGRPEVVEALFNLGLCQDRLGQLDEAEDTLKQLLIHDPLFVKAHLLLANLLFRQQRISEAADHYREAIRYAPLSAEAHGNLALILAGQRRMEEAGPHFARAIQLAPGNDELQFQYGMFLLSRRQPEAAIQAFEETLRINPQHPQARARWQQALSGAGSK